MVVWSTPITRSGLMANLRKIDLSSTTNYVLRCQGINQIQVRTCKSTGGTFNIIPSNFTLNKTKDLLKFHITLVSLPLLAIVLYTNIFIGPATLKPTPEGYEPKHWEYYSHPITRFISRYLTEDPQKTYEKFCFATFYYVKKCLISDIEKKVKFLISDRRDFQAWYYTPAFLKYTRKRVQRLENMYEKDLIASGITRYQ